MAGYFLCSRYKGRKETNPPECQRVCRKRYIRPYHRRLIPGTLLAIMGPSGCGKTTLLNILSRRLKSSQVTGDQIMAGSPFDDATLRAMSTYVEQEDHLIGSLTVHETVEFAAKLALPGTVTARQRRERTEEMLRDFGLMTVKDSKIGTPLQRGISGGQKRRVTTASQLITLPKIIFLGNIVTCRKLIADEPTSGLDSTSSNEIISCLRNTAQEYGVRTQYTRLTLDDRHRINSSTINKHPPPIRQCPPPLSRKDSLLWPTRRK